MPLFDFFNMYLIPNHIIATLFIVIAFLVLFWILYLIFKNPFKYPYFTYKFDVSSKRNVKIEDYIDNFLRNDGNWILIKRHETEILQWKKDVLRRINKSVFKKYRARQLKKILDDKRAYHFKLMRKQTRYQQQNYMKTSYKVYVLDSEWTTSWNWLESRYEQLKNIDFQATLNDYNSKNQRNLMTPQLRKKIMHRDNYTCQICGKYMPDEVGLHIDHIIPIVKGGKSVPSNLRVLCSKCNGKKGAK